MTEINTKLDWSFLKVHCYSLDQKNLRLIQSLLGKKNLLCCIRSSSVGESLNHVLISWMLKKVYRSFLFVFFVQQKLEICKWIENNLQSIEIDGENLFRNKIQFRKYIMIEESRSNKSDKNFNYKKHFYRVYQWFGLNEARWLFLSHIWGK